MRVLLSSILIVYCAAVDAETMNPGLHNTGLADNGSQLAAGAIDPHYVLVSVPSGSELGPSSYVFGYHTYLPDTTDSKWIGPTGDYWGIDMPGTYVYRTTFNLADSGITDVIINGRWATDHAGTDIRINGASTGFGTSTDGLFSPFTITSGFVSGLNNLDFVMENDPTPPGGNNPTALRIEFFSPAPEPSTLALLGVGAVGLVFCALQRKRRSI